MRFLVLTLVSACMLTACNDPKAANNKNFMRALEKHYAETKECISAPGEKFPVEKRQGYFRDSIADVLVEAGLLTVEKIIRRENLLPSFGSLAGKNDVEYSKYDLTDAGRKYLENGQFCYGRIKPVGVQRFSPPVASFGHTVSYIEYTYKVIDIPSWAKKESVWRQVPKLITALQSEEVPVNATIVARQMSDGWQLEKRIKF